MKVSNFNCNIVTYPAYTLYFVKWFKCLLVFVVVVQWSTPAICYFCFLFSYFCQNIQPVSNTSTPMEDFYATLRYNYSQCELSSAVLTDYFTLVTACFATVDNFLSRQVGDAVE